MAAVFFALTLLTGNTMAQAARERIPELAVLKTVGFRGRIVMNLVLAECVLMIAIGGTLGMLLATVAIGSLGAADADMPVAGVGITTWGIAMAWMLAMGLITGILPAARGMHLRIVDALAVH